MSSPRRTPSRRNRAPSSSKGNTPSRSSSRLQPSSSQPPPLDTSRDDDLESNYSELAQPLPPSSPTGVLPSRSGELVDMGQAGAVPTDSISAPQSVHGGGPMSNRTGPGSVRISEIDLSSPLNYCTPSSVGAGEVGLRTPRTNMSLGSVLGGRGGATPIKMRSDIQADSRLRQVSVLPSTPSSTVGGGDGVDPTMDSDIDDAMNAPIPPSSIGGGGGGGSTTTDPCLHIWGTDVDIESVKRRFKLFIETFVVNVTDDNMMTGSSDPLIYMNKLDEIETLGVPYCDVDMNHLQSFDGDLYRQLVCYPQEVIPALDMAITILFTEKYGTDAVLPHQIMVRPFNANKTKNMRSLNPEDIDQLITVCGMVIRSSSVIPEMSEALFQCYVCKATQCVGVEKGRIGEPTLCSNCQTNHSFSIVHNRSMFQDKQMVKLQESPDDMPAGQTPHTVILFAHDAMVDSVQPGDRVAVTGIYRAVPARVSSNVRNIKSIYRTHIDVLHFQSIDEKRLKKGSDESESNNEPTPSISTPFRSQSGPASFRPETIEKIEQIGSRPDCYECLARTLAPSIYGNEDVKKGILMQLFGGSNKDMSQTGRGGRFRSEINILLCGDPGTSKSQFLQYVYNLVPRSQYTSGKGSSAVGLTAYITKDPETRQLVLQTGALVLADNGICCIDEFDKMSESARSVLHEVMEQQTLSIAKAGIICQLNARTSVLAAANPIESQWNARKTIIENIQLPHTLLSRFDLIFLILDPQDELYDKRLGRHLVSLYYKKKDKKSGGDKSMNENEDQLLNSESGGLYDSDLLREYISYAKSNFPSPRLSDEAGTLLVQNYVAMRQFGSGRGQVTAFPRQLESLIRLSEAHAKMRLTNTVEVLDVEEATRLHKEALKQSATDPLSGRIDVSILTTGQSEASRKRRFAVKDAIARLVEEKRKKSGGCVRTLNYLKVWAEIKEGSDVMITRDMFEDGLKDLSDDGVITLTGRSTIRINVH